MKRSILETNIRQLLSRCELMAKEKSIEENWRLKKYVEALDDMISQLKATNVTPSKETLAEYTKRHLFLKALIQTTNLNNSAEKVIAVQTLSHGADPATKEIHQKITTKYGTELKSDLFGRDSEDSLGKRNIIRAPNFTSNGNTSEDMDTLMKFHQDVQEKVAENMLSLTRSLKEQSQVASLIIKRDTEVLKTSAEVTDENLSSLSTESQRLQEHTRNACKCWLWVMLACVVVIFIYMVIFMKVAKKQKYEL